MYVYSVGGCVYSVYVYIGWVWIQMLSWDELNGENISSRLSGNFQIFASEFSLNLEEMFPVCL